MADRKDLVHMYRRGIIETGITVKAERKKVEPN